MTRPPEPAITPLSVAAPAPVIVKVLVDSLIPGLTTSAAAPVTLNGALAARKISTLFVAPVDGLGADAADQDAPGAEDQVVVDGERIAAGRGDDVVEEIRPRREIIDVGELTGAGREDQRLIGVAGGRDAAEPVARSGPVAVGAAAGPLEVPPPPLAGEASFDGALSLAAGTALAFTAVT